MIFILFFTIPLLIILLMNSVLYVLTWLKLRSEIKIIRNNLGQCQRNRRTSSRVAKSMSLFVAAFFVQWWAAGLYGAWGLFGETPEFVTHASVTFTNIGGLLNLGVFIVIHRRGKRNFRKWNKRRNLPGHLTTNANDQHSSESDSKRTPIEQCNVSAIS